MQKTNKNNNKAFLACMHHEACWINHPSSMHTPDHRYASAVELCTRFCDLHDYMYRQMTVYLVHPHGRATPARTAGTCMHF